MAFDRSKFMHRFIEDADDHLASMNRGLLALGEAPTDRDTLDAVFRAAHTIKGSARMMKLIHVSDMAHALEDVLDALRKKTISFSDAVSQVLFDGMDTLSHMVTALSRGEENPGPKEMIRSLKRVADGEACSDEVHGPENDAPLPSPTVTDTPPSVGVPSVAASPDLSGRIAPCDGDVAPQNTKGSGEAPAGSEAPAGAGAEEESRKEPADETPSADAHSFSSPGKPDKQDPSEDKNGAPKTPETIRVNVDRLDALINLMGEVVSAHKTVENISRDITTLSLAARDFRTFLEQLPSGMAGQKESADQLPERFHAVHAGIDALQQDIQDHLGKFGPLMTQMQSRSLDMRMLPLSTLFDSLHMVVRDLCRNSGKQVHLEVTGGDTEMDKKMMEQLKDPLLHMVRNSIDHGIEREVARLKSGKSARGNLSIHATMDGGRIHITVSDDGNGIDVDAVARKAVDRGIVSRSALDDMDPAQRVHLIFHPGLSTAGIITDVSGRGVGMDVVRRNIEDELNGTISIESVAGQGTTFHVRLPETIAVVHVFIVMSGECIYAVPAGHVSEIVKVPGREILNAQGKAMLRLREALVPVISMNGILTDSGREMNLKSEEALLIIISGRGTDRMGMVVDTLLDEEERVVKPLPRHMRRLPLVSGAIISDTHGIIPVLHMVHLAARAAKIRGAGALNPGEISIGPVPASLQGDKNTPYHLLVVDDAAATREIEKFILESHGYKVTLAVDGRDALERARSHDFDLVVSDVDMPRMTGFELTEKLRADERHLHTPVVLVTARDSDADMKRGIAAGASAYIVKGDFDKNNLLETIENLLGTIN